MTTRTILTSLVITFSIGLGWPLGYAAATEEKLLPVTLDNFTRAETDLYFSKFARDGALGDFTSSREPASIDKQNVVRTNRDTLYSRALVDMNQGPVTVELPDAEGRYMALQVINEDHYTQTVIYQPGQYTLTREDIGTRYAYFLVRTFVDPGSTEDMKVVHALQDKLTLRQGAGASFEVPNWDVAAAARIRAALKTLGMASGGLDSLHMFGTAAEVDPVQHLIGTAAGWGGNPAREAYYLGIEPAENDGKTAYQLRVKHVPVDGFWSISVYDKNGFFEKNTLDAYSVNNVTAKPDADGGVTVRFGGCQGYSGNCLPITPGWNYLVRLYRPHENILDGSWRFPAAVPVE